MRRRLAGLGAVGLLVLAGCATVNTTRGGAVGVQRQQSMLVSSKEMDQGARQAYAQTLQQAGRKQVLNQNPAQVERVRAIAKRLIPQTAVFRPDAPGWQWEVNVIASKELNAWCMPGGKIAFYTGLIDGLNLKDDEIAAVMGHEIAHALREHSREKASQAMVANVGLSLVGIIAGLNQSQLDLAGTVTNVTFMLPNSREFETEADRMGVELAARAGYDPSAAVRVWEKMIAKSDGQPPQWLSTHPSHQTRIADLRHYSELVQPLYEQATGKTHVQVDAVAAEVDGSEPATPVKQRRSAKRRNSAQ
jgi:predicted Zn-dependent protease